MARRTDPDPLAKKIGERVRFLRGTQGLTLEKLAYSCDFSKGQLSTIERGLAIPTAKTLAKLAEGLDLSPLDLLTFPEESEREKLIDLTRGLSSSQIQVMIVQLEGFVKSK